MSYYSQSNSNIRLEWGLEAVERLGADVDCIVVCDVMSFSSCVSLALDRNGIVYPYPWRDDTADAFGAKRGAHVASERRRFAGGWSLSPQSMLKVTGGLRLVLPSPNGSACAYQAGTFGKAVYSLCLRNLQATADACHAYSRVLVVPCGERWPSQGSLRPCLEDYVVAGGLVHRLGRPAERSPEARAAAGAWIAMASDLGAGLAACSSGLELIERGFAEDVELCTQEDVSRFACRLDGECFVRESSR